VKASKALGNLAACVCVSLVLTGCGDDEWQGYVYPDKSNLLNDERIGSFDTLESCREAANRYISRLASPITATYECGLNCEPYGSGLSVCEKTLQ